MNELAHDRHLRFTLPSVIGLIVLGGIAASVLTHCPHWLNRAGAAIAAVAAGAILLQIRAELALEEERSQLEAKADAAKEDVVVGPLGDLSAKLEINRIEIQRKEVAARRLRVGARVVAVAMLGELLHGFGDQVMCLVFRVCGECH